MAVPEGMTAEEFFRIKSEAARRASETKRQGDECEAIIRRAIYRFQTENRERLAAMTDAENQATVSRFKQDLMRRAIALSGDIVVKRRAGGIVLEAFVGLESIVRAVNEIAPQGESR